MRSITPRSNVGLDVQATVIGGTESVAVPHNDEAWRTFFLLPTMFSFSFLNHQKIVLVSRKFQSLFEITFKRLSN